MQISHQEVESPIFNCGICGQHCSSKSDMENHVIDEHPKETKHDEWICNDCPFQANSADELMKHLRISGHQPSQHIQNSKSRITHCYTCKEEFSSYWHLMKHRKQKHPSNKICRYFLKNQCVHGIDCWYRHDEPMEIDSGIKVQNNKYGDRAKTFEKKRGLKTHERQAHTFAAFCENFEAEPQENSNATHEEDFQDSGFQFPPPNNPPPDQMEMVMQTLNMVLQKMASLEASLQKK